MNKQEIMNDVKLAGTILDRRRKINPSMVEQIKDMFNNGAKRAEIARYFNVSSYSVKSIVDINFNKKEAIRLKASSKRYYNNLDIEHRKERNKLNSDRVFKYKSDLINTKLNNLLERI